MGFGGGGSAGGTSRLVPKVPAPVTPGMFDYDTSNCATAECAAGLLPAPSDNRTQAQIDYGQCKLVCNISATPAVAACNVAAGGGLPGAVVGNVTKMSVCSLVCK
jgi:hypothetical protein